MDSSSIVKLYVAEPGSREARAAYDRSSGLVTSLVSYAEVRATFAGMRRGGLMRLQAQTRASSVFESSWPDFFAYEVSQAVIRSAGDLSEQHALSGFDAIHLATAIAFREISPDIVELSTFDDRLRRAAIAEGFVVV